MDNSFLASLLLAAVVVLFAAAAPAAVQAVTAGEFAETVAMQRYRIYAEHCSAKVPALSSRFEDQVKSLGLRVREVAGTLRQSEAFRDVDNKPVPVEIVDAFRDSFEDLGHNFERQDAASACPQKLQSLTGVDDNALRSNVEQAFTAVRNMMRNLAVQSERLTHR